MAMATATKKNPTVTILKREYHRLLRLASPTKTTPRKNEQMKALEKVAGLWKTQPRTSRDLSRVRRRIWR